MLTYHFLYVVQDVNTSEFFRLWMRNTLTDH